MSNQVRFVPDEPSPALQAARRAARQQTPSGFMSPQQIAAMWRNDARVERTRATTTDEPLKSAKLARAEALESCAHELELHLAV